MARREPIERGRHGYLRFGLDLVQAEKAVVVRARHDAVDAVVHQEHLLQSEMHDKEEKKSNDREGGGTNYSCDDLQDQPAHA